MRNVYANIGIYLCISRSCIRKCCYTKHTVNRQSCSSAFQRYKNQLKIRFLSRDTNIQSQSYLHCKSSAPSNPNFDHSRHSGALFWSESVVLAVYVSIYVLVVGSHYIQTHIATYKYVDPRTTYLCSCFTPINPVFILTQYIFLQLLPLRIPLKQSYNQQ